MHIADALSRAYLPYCHTHDTGDHVLAVELQDMYLTEDVHMSTNGLQEIIDKSLEDDEIKACGDGQITAKQSTHLLDLIATVAMSSAHRVEHCSSVNELSYPVKCVSC